MLDQASIAKLEERIGFGTVEIAVPVAPHHRVGTSGRTLPWFHALANLGNIYNTAENRNMTDAEFDAYLAQLKKDAVLSVVDSVFRLDPNYTDAKDYSYVVDKHPTLFDNAIGYTLAVDVIQKAVSTIRENDHERNARLSYSNLKVELDGLMDRDGNVVSRGLKRAQYVAAKDVASILFPSSLYIEAPDVW